MFSGQSYPLPPTPVPVTRASETALEPRGARSQALRRRWAARAHRPAGRARRAKTRRCASAPAPPGPQGPFRGPSGSPAPSRQLERVSGSSQLRPHSWDQRRSAPADGGPSRPRPAESLACPRRALRPLAAGRASAGAEAGVTRGLPRTRLLRRPQALRRCALDHGLRRPTAPGCFSCIGLLSPTRPRRPFLF